MSFPLYPATERQKRLVTLAGELANVFASRANEDDWQGQFPYENYKDLRRSGLLGLTVPRDLGGWGVDLLELTLTLHRLAQGCASTALVLTMHLSAIGRAASECSKFDERFADICHAVIHDSLILNVAATEPATGSPSRGGHPTTTACRQADGSWLITGRKTYTTGSNILGAFIISSSIKDDTPPDAGLPSLASNQGAFLIPRDSKGVRVEETWHALSMRSSASNDLILENVHVGQEAYVPELFSFTPAAQQRQAAWILPLAAVYLGIAQAARDEAIRFARQRRPNSLDQPISSLPHIQDKAAKMELALLQSQAVLFGLAAQYSQDPASIPRHQFAAAKYLVTNYAIEVVDLAMRLVGGASLSVSLPLQRYYRDVRAGLHNPPMDDATFALLGRQAFEQ